MNTACKFAMNCDVFRILWVFILLVLLPVGCAPYTDPGVRLEPAGKHDRMADQKFCSSYAEQYGTISLEPMLGEKALSQPDRRRRSRLFIMCMEEKGYKF